MNIRSTNDRRRFKQKVYISFSCKEGTSIDISKYSKEELTQLCLEIEYAVNSSLSNYEDLSIKEVKVDLSSIDNISITDKYIYNIFLTYILDCEVSTYKDEDYEDVCEVNENHLIDQYSINENRFIKEFKELRIIGSSINEVNVSVESYEEL